MREVKAGSHKRNRSRFEKEWPTESASSDMTESGIFTPEKSDQFPQILSAIDCVSLQNRQLDDRLSTLEDGLTGKRHIRDVSGQREPEPLRKRPYQKDAPYKYQLVFKTGDHKYIFGRGIKVNVTLSGGGFQSKEKFPRMIFTKESSVELEMTTGIPEVEKIELTADFCSWNRWFLECIIVKGLHDDSEVPFPILNWVKNNHPYTLLPYDTFLPRNDPGPVLRAEGLREKQKSYKYRPWWPTLPTDTSLPQDEHFSLTYALEIFGKSGVEAFLASIDSLSHKEFKNVHDVKSIFNKTGFPTPPDMDSWDDDKKFAMQRLAGANPRQIALCKEIPQNMGVENKMVAQFLEGKTLHEAVSDKKIFIVNHEILHKIKPTTGKTICAPIALFYQQNNGTLIPIAIQLYQEKGRSNPVFLPTDSCTWILAKMWFNNADAQVHQTLAHLGFTHLYMEGVDVASNRQLAVAHPIYKLLKPHFLYLLAINTLAINHLLEKGGFFDTGFSIGATAGLGLIHQCRSTWRLDVDGTVPKDLENRGVADTSLLPDYYYRDDSLLIYNAFKKYVNDYVEIYYHDNKDVCDDSEIQAWRADLVKEAPLGAGLKGVPGTDGKFTTKEELVLTLTSIIFSCSAQHAAVNFTQYDEYAFPLNYPSQLRGKPPTDKKKRTMKDVIESLPEPKAVLKTNVILSVLSTHATLSLGHYEINYIYDPKAVCATRGLRQQLADISKKIEQEERSRRQDYHYLDPKEIPNAISI